MTISQVVAIQLSTSRVEVIWAANIDPAAGFEIHRVVNTGAKTDIGVTAGDHRTFLDGTISLLETGDTVVYSVEDLDTLQEVNAPSITLIDPTVDYTYGVVNPLVSTIRYTSLSAVKRQLGITDTAWDTEATQAIIALEVMMDTYMNRSFPDTGDNPEIDGIPEQVKQAALLGAMSIFKLGDAPGGVAGSDDFIGTWEPVDNRTRLAFNSVKPMLIGYRAPEFGGFA